MASEYYLRETCARAIATKLSKRAHDYVTDDMLKCREQLLDAQREFNTMVEDAASKMLSGR